MRTELQRRWKGRLWLLVTAVAVALAAAELTVRLCGLAPAIRPVVIMGPDTVYQRSPNTILGYELKPGYHNDDADSIFACLRTNRHGQRDVERSLERPPNVRRVIILGDSVVESLEVRRIDDLMNRRLERLYPDGKVEVLNFGVNGYCTLAEIELLRVKGLAFQPDVVVLVFVENDFHNFNRGAHAEADPVKRPRVVNVLFRSSHLFRLAGVKLNLMHLGGVPDPVKTNRGGIGDNNVVQGLALLRKLADEHGFLPVIAVWPVFHADGIRDAHYLPGKDVLVIEALAHRYCIPVVRLSGHFREHLQSLPESTNPLMAYTVGDGQHPNELGCSIAAAGIRDVLDRLPSLPMPPARGAGAREGQALYEQAVRLAGKEGEREYDLAGAYLDSAVKLQEHGRLDEAMRCLESARRAAPDSTRVLNMLGVLRVQQQHPLEGIELFRAALDRDPGDAQAHNNWGNALLQLGRFDEALQHFERAVELDRYLVQAHNNLGVCLMNRGKRAEAEVHFRQVVEIDPAWSVGQVNLARCLLIRENAEQALEPLDRAEHLGATGVSALRQHAADLLDRQGKRELARKQHEKASGHL